MAAAPTLTEAQMAIVKATAPVLKEHGTTITSVFYNNMLDENPSLNNMFSTTSKVTGRQPRALANAVLAYATYIDDLGKLSHAVARIAHKHVSLQVTPEQYDIVGRYLIQAIGQVLGEAATPAIVDAWTAAYGVLANVFIGTEGAMYERNATEDHWVGWRKFRILRKVQESSVVTSFYLGPSDGGALPRFLPGQYVSLQVPVPQLGYLQSRQYSLSEAPREKGEHYRISVKKEDGVEAGIPGIISNMLHEQFKEGDEVELSHPQGEFFLDPTDASKEGVPAVLISGGVGATPLMSILGSLVREEGTGKAPAVKRPVSWVQASRTSEARPFVQEVKRIVQDNANVSAHIFLEAVTAGKDVEGVDYHYGGTQLDVSRLDGQRDLHLDDARTEYYLCGPEAFLVEIRRALVALGVDKTRVHLELFATGDVPDDA